MKGSICREQCWEQGGAGCCSSSSSSFPSTAKLMMAVRGSMGGTIGDVATFVHLHGTRPGLLYNLAPAAEKPSAPMMGSGAAAKPIAPAATVKSGL